MSEKKVLTDEQLEQVNGGVITLTHEGTTVTFGGPETWLAFSEMERKCGFTGYQADSDLEECMFKYEAEYQTWYYNYYGCPHPHDVR